MRRFYALLLTAYPAAFRRRFGAELALAFEAGLAQARAHGRLTTIRYLLANAADAIGSGARERRSNRWYSPRAARDPLMAIFLHDMAFGFRLLRRNPVSLYSIAHGLLIRSLSRLMNVDPGIRAENVLTLKLELPRTRTHLRDLPPGHAWTVRNARHPDHGRPRLLVGRWHQRRAARASTCAPASR